MSAPIFTASRAGRVVECCAPEAALEGGQPWAEPNSTVGYAAHLGTLLHECAYALFRYMAKDGKLAYFDEQEAREICLQTLSDLHSSGHLPASFEPSSIEEVVLRAKATASFLHRLKRDCAETHSGPWFEVKRGFSPYSNAAIGWTGYTAHADGHRNYSRIEDGDIALTTDVEFSPEDDESPYIVIDLKFGRRENVPTARYNWQGKVAACSIWYDQNEQENRRNGFGSNGVRLMLLFVDEHGIVSTSSHDFTTDEIYEAATQLSEVAFEIRSGYSIPRIGEHCVKSFCKFRQVCPAQERLTERVTEEVKEKRLNVIRTNEDALAAIRELPSLKKWVKEREQAIRDYAAQNEVTDDGKVYRQKSTRRFLGLTAEGMIQLVALCEAHELDIDEVAPRKTSKGALQKHLGRDFDELADEIINTEVTGYGWTK